MTDLSEKKSEMLEVPVQCVDQHAPLYYQVYSTDTLGDLKKQVAEYEGMDAKAINIIPVGPDIVLGGQTIGGRYDYEFDDDYPLTEFNNLKFIIYPANGYSAWKDAVNPIKLSVESEHPSVHTLFADEKTTIGDLKKFFAPQLQLPASEMRVSYNYRGDDLKDDVLAVTPSKDGVTQLYVDIRDHPISINIHGVDEFMTVTIQTSVKRLIDEIYERLDEEESVYEIAHLWLGGPEDSQRIDIADEDNLIYEALAQAPDKTIYVDLKEEEE